MNCSYYLFRCNQKVLCVFCLLICWIKKKEILTERRKKIEREKKEKKSKKIKEKCSHGKYPTLKQCGNDQTTTVWKSKWSTKFFFSSPTKNNTENQVFKMQKNQKSQHSNSNRKQKKNNWKPFKILNILFSKLLAFPLLSVCCICIYYMLIPAVRFELTAQLSCAFCFSFVLVSVCLLFFLLYYGRCFHFQKQS